MHIRRDRRPTLACAAGGLPSDSASGRSLLLGLTVVSGSIGVSLPSSASGGILLIVSA
jgi:hypothetical protein